MNEGEYIKRVFGTLSNNPTAADLDFLVEAHVRIGYLAAEAENLYEQAVDARKYHEANAYLEAKSDATRKLSDKAAEAVAQVNCWSFRTKETEAKVKSRKLGNLLESVEQAINAIKFIGRFDSSSISVPR